MLGVVASTIGVWANRTLYDADTFAGTIDSALAQPEVTDALAAYATDQVFRVVAVDRGLEGVLPGRLESLSPVLTTQLKRRVHAQVAELLAKPNVRAGIVEGARRSHATLLHAVDTGGIADLRLADGAITLNVLPLVTAGINALPSNPVTRQVDIPRLAWGGDHGAQVAELSEALGVVLPPDLGSIEVYRGDAADRADAVLKAVRSSLVLFRRTIGITLAVTAVGFVVALGVAVKRRRAALWLLLGALVAYGLANLAIRYAVSRAPLLAVEPANRAALRAVIDRMSSGLIGLLNVAVIVIAVTWLVVFAVGLIRRGGGHGIVEAPVSPPAP